MLIEYLEVLVAWEANEEPDETAGRKKDAEWEERVRDVLGSMGRLKVEERERGRREEEDAEDSDGDRDTEEEGEEVKIAMKSSSSSERALS